MATVTNNLNHDIDIAGRAALFVYGDSNLPGDYFGMFGTTHSFGCTNKGDNTKYITAFWKSKETDPADQFGEEYKDQWYQVDRFRLFYKDESADTPVTVYVSKDGGVSWISQYRELGTGDEKSKSADFFFTHMEGCVGQFFVFKVECASNSHSFTWLGFHVDLIARGPHFEV